MSGRHQPNVRNGFRDAASHFFGLRPCAIDDDNVESCMKSNQWAQRTARSKNSNELAANGSGEGREGSDELDNSAACAPKDAVFMSSEMVME